jgi:DNA-directed RNA polymerase sigma subunit (sigma70/sigma32)
MLKSLFRQLTRMSQHLTQRVERRFQQRFLNNTGHDETLSKLCGQHRTQRDTK